MPNTAAPWASWTRSLKLRTVSRNRARSLLLPISSHKIECCGSRAPAVGWKAWQTDASSCYLVVFVAHLYSTSHKLILRPFWSTSVPSASKNVGAWVMSTNAMSSGLPYSLTIPLEKWPFSADLLGNTGAGSFKQILRNIPEDLEIK